MFSMIATVVMIIILIYGITKKYNTIMLLFSVALASLLIWTFVTGQSVLGENTTGSIFLDIFELIYTTAQTQLAGTCLVVMSVLGYVSYMNHINASKLFALIVSKPLMKVQKPYLLASLVIVLGAFLKIVIPSAVSCVTLLLATLYPVLLAVGVTKATAASCLALSTVIVWGPADSLAYLIFGIAGITNTSVPEWFITNEFPIVMCMFISIIIIFPITSKYFDKKENAQKGSIINAGETAKDLGLPYFYALLPLLPLIFVLIFSQLVLKTIIISVVAANFLSLFIVMILHMIVQKKTKDVFNDTQEFFNGIGRFMGSMGFIIVAGSVFATAINQVGGMTKLVEIISGAGGGTISLTVIGCILAFVCIACTGSVTANMNLFAPLFMNIAQITGGNILTMYTALLLSAGLGSGLTPVSGTMIIVSETCEVSIPTILKRNFVPLIFTLAVCLIATFIIL